MSDVPGRSGTDWSVQSVRRRHYTYSRTYGSYGSWVPGILLIALGAVFLAENYFGATLRNWWALFILIPAFGGLAVAYEEWRAGDAQGAVGPLVGGLAFLGLAIAFLLDLPIAQLWPVALIILGIGLLVGRRSWS